jgi:hypothetical protein
LSGTSVLPLSLSLCISVDLSSVASVGTAAIVFCCPFLLFCPSSVRSPSPSHSCANRHLHKASDSRAVVLNQLQLSSAPPDVPNTDDSSGGFHADVLENSATYASDSPLDCFFLIFPQLSQPTEPTLHGPNRDEWSSGEIGDGRVQLSSCTCNSCQYTLPLPTALTLYAVWA